ncbi:MAG TPA: hypothetical protein VJ299_18325, partial [Steroidobacteraceae bacterium]|nr:hypothetical protein [Steroidobacteraceae bacterium]
MLAADALALMERIFVVVSGTRSQRGPDTGQCQHYRREEPRHLPSPEAWKSPRTAMFRSPRGSARTA